jgi:hypothetical protein
MAPLDLKRFFLDQVPGAFLRDSITVLNAGYKSSHEACTEGFAEPEAHDLYGHHRRATNEMGWRTTAQRHGLKASVVWNSRRTYSHTRVAANEVVMTESFVNHQGDLIRPADFRGTLAQENQLNLFRAPAGGNATSLFAILTHGLSRHFPDRLSFIWVEFPNADCTGYVDGFDLFQEFPDLALAIRPTAADLAAKRAELRRQRDEQGS